jgi:hypothetical protein
MLARSVWRDYISLNGCCVKVVVQWQNVMRGPVSPPFCAVCYIIDECAVYHVLICYKIKLLRKMGSVICI